MQTENIYRIKNYNYMTHIHDNKVNKISECNILHDTINPYKHTKNVNIHHSLILHGRINTTKGKAKFRNF